MRESSEGQRLNSSAKAAQSTGWSWQHPPSETSSAGRKTRKEPGRLPRARPTRNGGSRLGRTAPDESAGLGDAEGCPRRRTASTTTRCRSTWRPRAGRSLSARTLHRTRTTVTVLCGTETRESATHIIAQTGTRTVRTALVCISLSHTNRTITSDQSPDCRQIIIKVT